MSPQEGIWCAACCCAGELKRAWAVSYSWSKKLNYRDIDIQQKMWFTIPASPWFPHCSPSPLRSRTSWMELSQPHWWLWPTGRQLGRSQEQRALQGQGWLLPRQEHPGARRSSPGSALTKHSPRESGQGEQRWILVSLHSPSPGSWSSTSRGKPGSLMRNKWNKTTGRAGNRGTVVVFTGFPG